MCPCVCLLVSAIPPEPFNIRTQNLQESLTLTTIRMSLKVRVICLRSRSPGWKTWFQELHMGWSMHSFFVITSVVRKISNRRLCGHQQAATLVTMGIWGWKILMKFLVKLANFKMAVSLEPFDRFWCLNFWEKARDVCFHSGKTAGPSDHYNRRNTAAAASFGQHWIT